MTLLKKIIAASVCLLALSLSGICFASGLHDMLPDSIKSSGKIVIGINGIFAPMEYQDPESGKLVGIDVEIADAIAKELGVKVQYDDQQFDQLINSINTKRVDMVISGMSDSAVRRKTLDFIDYFNSGTQCFVPKALAGQIKSLEDLSGKTLAVSASTDYLTTMQRWSKENLVAKGKAGINIMAVDSAGSARMQMVQGRAQASALSPEALGWVNIQQNNAYVAVGPLLESNPYGIAFSKDNTQLRDAVFAALEKVFADGTYMSILKKWGADSGALAKPLINGESPK
ncbi:ABC transporter substrate-binding protein [Maridesulfovibrio sp.]|uniref:ABC transporter substrate-binding protein n=1 Tax=Maridesulfovibrio sp. TaxID=2795000 RepID=UPI002A18B612|nr:ABC transporter substrate-binding protein [Maridesulfovibrio sp.]